jgi:hypothetical protein
MSQPIHPRYRLRIADEVFLATARLHREYPKRTDFRNAEIQKEVENLFQDSRSGVTTHITSHCVANKSNHSAAAFRMLYETSYGNKRLLLSGDRIDPSRTGDIFPDAERIPSHFRELVTWARKRFENGLEAETPGTGSQAPKGRFSSVLGMRGLGKELWRDETADEYVRRLREGWE